MTAIFHEMMFWTEVVSTACYVLNRVLVTNPHNKTPYELLSGKISNISHLKPFGCLVTILNTSDHLGKFEGKADEGFIVGYAAHSKAYRVYNLSSKKIEETLNLRYLEDKPNVHGLGHEWYFDLDYLTDSLGYTRFKTNQPAGPPAIIATIDRTPYTITESLVRSQLQLDDEGGVKDLPTADIYLGMDNMGYPTEGKLTFHKNNILGDLTSPIQTRAKFAQALNDPAWVEAMQEEMQQFISQKVWQLVPLPDGKIAIGTKCILKNKRDARVMSAMGELTILPLAYKREQKPDGIFISQDTYVQDMLKKFDMESVRHATTPFDASKPKSKDEPNDAVNVHLYRSMIVKKIFKYLKGQPKLGLWYPRDSHPLWLMKHICKKQTIMATSSSEAEYVVAANCCGQVLKIHTDENVADLLTKAFDGP
ncbi:putative ribonuclease H-like domain-containing protein, partial [Tanacetum coccineum]